MQFKFWKSASHILLGRLAGSLFILAILFQDAFAENPSYVAGEIIVQFRSDGPYAVTASAKKTIRQRKKFKKITADKSNSIDLLIKKFGISAARPLFIDGELSPTHAKQKLKTKQDKTEARYPKRAKRARKTAAEPNVTNYYLMTTSKALNLETVCAAFRSDRHVESCQPNYLLRRSATMNDPYLLDGSLWGISASQINGAWDLTQGENVVVAVIDDRIDQRHIELLENLAVTNPCEDVNHNGRVDISDFNGIDDACPGENIGNGAVDDISGANLCTSPIVACRTTGSDDHGTHVAGTIAAVGNNGLGIVGAAPRAKILPVQAFGQLGASITDLINAFEYAVEQGADVINNSWGFDTPVQSIPALEDAVRLAQDAGAVVVFAAGNSNADVANYSPQNMTSPKPIVVAATTTGNIKAGFSNFGTLVDVAAPGVDILSLLPLNSIGYGSGTSMAAPHVSGVAALLLSVNPDLSNDDVREIIRSSATPLSDSRIGAGLLNAAAAVNRPTITSFTINGELEAGSQRPTQAHVVLVNPLGTIAHGMSLLMSIDGDGIPLFQESFSVDCGHGSGVISIGSCGIVLPIRLPSSVDSEQVTVRLELWQQSTVARLLSVRSRSAAVNQLSAPNLKIPSPRVGSRVSREYFTVRVEIEAARGMVIPTEQFSFSAEAVGCALAGSITPSQVINHGFGKRTPNARFTFSSDPAPGCDLILTARASHDAFGPVGSLTVRIRGDGRVESGN